MSADIKNNSYDLPIGFADILESAPLGILIFDTKGIIKTITKNFFSISGIKSSRAKELVGANILKDNLFVDWDISGDLQGLVKGDPFEKILSQKKSSRGGTVNLIIKGTPLQGKEKFNGGMLIIEDMKYDAGSDKDDMIYLDKFNDFLFGISDYFIVADSEGEVLLCPKKGYSRKYEAIAKRFKEDKSNIFLLTEDNTIEDLMGKLKVEGKTVNKDILVITEKEQFVMNVSLVPILSKNQSIQYVIILLNDITHIQDEKEFFESEITELRRYHNITSKIIDAVISFDLSGKINFLNESATKLFGYTKSEIFGKSISKVVPIVDKNFLDRIKSELTKNKIWEGEFKIGNERNAEYLSVRMAMVGDGENRSVVMLCSSITERVEGERELRLSEEKFRNIVLETTEYICTLDLEGNITFANPNFIKAFGYPEDELLNLNFVDLVLPDYVKINNFRVTVNSISQNDSIELPLITRKKKEMFVLAGFHLIKDINGNPKYFNVALTDISNRKESQKHLQLIRSVFEASQEGIAVFSKRKLILVNDYFVKMFGYNNLEEVLGKDPLDFVADEDIPKVAKYIQTSEKNLRLSSRYDFIGKKKDESTFFLEDSVITYEMEGEYYIVSVLRDITESRKAKQELEESELRYRNISENINECIWTAERVEGKIEVVFYTPAIEKITGYSSKQFFENKKHWYQIIHPDDVSTVITKLKRLYKDSGRTFEEMEYRIINKMGNIIWIKNKINIIRDKQGKTQRVYGLVSDISLTKKVEADLRSTTNMLKQLNETKDRFISVISHDLRAPFSSILGFTDFLLNDRGLTNEKRLEYISFIKESSQSMLSLVTSLLDWTRIQTGRIPFEPERINSRAIINRSIQIMSGNAAIKKIQLISKVDYDMYVHADENLLLQVFNNLVSNAIKFTKPEGNIWVSADPVIEKRHVKFSVKDNGVGIRQTDIDKLFKVDSKFTSPGTSGERGSGLGLSLCYDIVKKHGGDIWVESKFGEGTELFFTIPISSTKILLVDDVNTDRLLYSKLLKSFLPDYTVEEASNGKEAYDLIKKSLPALIITDHKMPVMSGYDLVKQLSLSDLKFKPPVIILSGDIMESIEEEYRELGVEFIFRKPVNLATFKFALDKSLRKAISDSHA